MNCCTKNVAIQNNRNFIDVIKNRKVSFVRGIWLRGWKSFFHVAVVETDVGLAMICPRTTIGLLLMAHNCLFKPVEVFVWSTHSLLGAPNWPSVWALFVLEKGVRHTINLQQDGAFAMAAR